MDFVLENARIVGVELQVAGGLAVGQQIVVAAFWVVLAFELEDVLAFELEDVLASELEDVLASELEGVLV